MSRKEFQLLPWRNFVSEKLSRNSVLAEVGKRRQRGRSHYLDNLDKAREYRVAGDSDEWQVREHVRDGHRRQRRYDGAFPAARAAPRARGAILHAALRGILSARE